MAVQELVDDTFEGEALKALISAGGVQDIRQGPRSGGTSFVLLHHLVGATEGSIRGRPAVMQGPNVLANAIEDLARAAKVSIRTGTDVSEIVVRDDRVAGVALASGEEITAPVVLSTLDPASTIRRVDPVWLDPDFLHAVRKIKFRGIRATALFAMDGLPDTTGLDGVVSCTPTTVALEQAYDAAKYGENSSGRTSSSRCLHCAGPISRRRVSTSWSRTPNGWRPGRTPRTDRSPTLSRKSSTNRCPASHRGFATVRCFRLGSLPNGMASPKVR
jgi:phytoene dehydrogenase-like protein